MADPLLPLCKKKQTLGLLLTENLILVVLVWGMGMAMGCTRVSGTVTLAARPPCSQLPRRVCEA